MRVENFFGSRAQLLPRGCAAHLSLGLASTPWLDEASVHVSLFDSFCLCLIGLADKRGYPSYPHARPPRRMSASEPRVW
jgi:hypothetical protein